MSRRALRRAAQSSCTRVTQLSVSTKRHTLPSPDMIPRNAAVVLGGGGEALARSAGYPGHSLVVEFGAW